MYAFFFEEEYVEYDETDERGYTFRMSNYVIRESMDACYRALDFFNIGKVCYECGAERETREEALAFCFAEWYGICEQDAVEVLADEQERRRFERKELKVVWPGDEPYDEEYDK